MIIASITLSREWSRQRHTPAQTHCIDTMTYETYLFVGNKSSAEKSLLDGWWKSQRIHDKSLFASLLVLLGLVPPSIQLVDTTKQQTFGRTNHAKLQQVCTCPEAVVEPVL